MNAVTRLLCVLLLLSATACSTLGPAQRERAAGIAVSARDSAVACEREDRCALPSELHALGAAALARLSLNPGQALADVIGEWTPSASYEPRWTASRAAEFRQHWRALAATS